MINNPYIRQREEQERMEQLEGALGQAKRNYTQHRWLRGYLILQMVFGFAGLFDSIVLGLIKGNFSIMNVLLSGIFAIVLWTIVKVHKEKGLLPAKQRIEEIKEMLDTI